MLRKEVRLNYPEDMPPCYDSFSPLDNAASRTLVEQHSALRESVRCKQRRSTPGAVDGELGGLDAAVSSDFFSWSRNDTFCSASVAVFVPIQSR